MCVCVQAYIRNAIAIAIAHQNMLLTVVRILALSRLLLHLLLRLLPLLLLLLLLLRT